MATNKEVCEETLRKTYNNIDCKDQLIYLEVVKNKFAGYKRELLVNSLSEVEIDFYVCTECKGVMHNACQKGEDVVCEGCVMDGVPSQALVKSRKKIPELQAKCPLAARNCDWDGTLAEVEEHIIFCEKFVVKCENACDVILPRSELNYHLMHSCVKRRVMCEHCKISFAYEKLTNHYQECMEYQVPCPNDCGENLKRKLIDSHLGLECPNMEVKCPYKKLGCEQKLLRCELEEHKQTNQIQHLECTRLFAVKEMEELKQTNIQLNEQLTETNKKLTETNRQLAETNKQLTETKRQQNVTDRQLSGTNRQLSETNRQLSETQSQQTTTDSQLSETYRQLTETKKQQVATDRRQTITNRQQSNTNTKLTEKLETLENQLAALTPTIERLSYPIILYDAFLVLQKYKPLSFEVNWKFRKIRVMFRYSLSKKSVYVTVSMEYDDSRTPFAKWLFEGRFKLTIIDNMHAENSLIYESKVVKLQPQNGNDDPSEYPSSFSLATISTPLLYESRFLKGKGVNFTLQIQEIEDSEG